MDENTIQDLKQFIATTVSQHVSELHSDVQSLRLGVESLRSDIKSLDAKLSLKIDDLSKSVAEAIETSSDTTDAQLNDHEHRIVRLERKTA